jgi:long-chain acyl-CoA synthetase
MTSANLTPNNIRAAHSTATLAGDALLVDTPSLGALLAERARENPQATYLKYFDDDTGETSTLSYAEFDRAVDAAAGGLVAHGLKLGDCIATLSWNHPHAAVILFAAWRLGLIVAPLNMSEDDVRLAFIVKDAEAKLLIVQPALLERGGRIAGGVEVLPFDGFNDSGTPPLDIAESDHRRAAALIVYTSGTTGAPKGVVLTQHNLMINARVTADVFAIDRATTMMCVLPIHHVNGIVVTLLGTLIGGGRLILNRSFKAGVFWNRMAEHRVAIVSVVPTILQFLLEANEDTTKLDLSAFRYFLCGAGTLPVALVTRFEDRFNVVVQHLYGLSETTAACAAMPPDLSPLARRDWYVHHGYPSFGVALPNTEMAIHDPNGNALPAGARGEIVIRGPFIMEGYFRRPDANAETFKHGWFRSGDEGFFETDETGHAFYFITGRIKELINRGGVKYSPFEIEEVLLSIPGVKVGLAIGFDNDWYGEEVGAYVVREAAYELTEGEVLAACRAKMPFAKSPKAVVFGESAPVTITGKYQRLMLKDRFAAFKAVQFRERDSVHH